ncbi:MAG TPA: TIGR03435 family protein [Bryobacteraceae bacterium]
MTRAFAGTCFFSLLLPAGFAQAPAPPPHFDIADVRVSPRADWIKTGAHAMQGGFLLRDRYKLHRATMLDLIRTAYAVDADKVFGGPSWLDYDRFNIVAKAPPNTRPATLRLMLQALLADRFKLVVKQDTKPVPAYLLSKGKGEVNLKPAEGSSSSGCSTLTPNFSRDGPPTGGIQCRNVTMEAFASALRRVSAASFQNLPVVDATGIEGAWDFEIRYALLPVNPGAGAAPQRPPLLEAVEKQLGLSLELKTAPQPVLVVEGVEEQPSPNAPGVEGSLPPLPPPQFEVASIRPCNGNCSATIAPRFEPGGRVTATGMPLGGLIRQAFNLAPFEQPVGMPKWLNDGTTAHNISIVAKAPEGVAPDAQNNAQARDLMNAMIRALLVDRYKMVTHYEERPMDAYTLVAVKPKLTKADPSRRTGCTRRSGTGLQTQLDCTNMTMEQFAEQIQAYDADTFYPVADGTHIEGAWDFTINYDALASLAARLPPALAGRGGAGPNGDAPDPSGAISFTDALEKQLGLKLVKEKRPERVLVIDHIEETPTEN